MWRGNDAITQLIRRSHYFLSFLLLVRCCSLLLLHVDMPHSAFYTGYHVFVLLHRWGGCLLVHATLLLMVYVYAVLSAKSPLNVSSAASRLSNPLLLCSLGMSLPFRIRHVTMRGTQATQSLGLPFQDDLGPFVVTCSHSLTQPPTHIGFRESYPCRQAEFTFGKKGGLQPDMPAGLSWCGMKKFDENQEQWNAQQQELAYLKKNSAQLKNDYDFLSDKIGYNTA
ncbi:hypothetical protein MIR68_010004 [Amoeboaphelidium protococcarum]|nr:hypothetical protein MIR68_010004 [Amoeboaphelidium protococcarum]